MFGSQHDGTYAKHGFDGTADCSPDDGYMMMPGTNFTRHLTGNHYKWSTCTQRIFQKFIREGVKKNGILFHLYTFLVAKVKVQVH